MRPRLVVAAVASAALALFASGVAVALVSSAPTLGVHWESEHATSTHPPDSALAVGPNDLIEATNAGVARFKTNHAEEGHMESIAAFLRAAEWPKPPGAPKGTPSSAPKYLRAKCCVDPRAGWDDYLHRFWFSAQQGPSIDGTAYVFVAFSKSTSAAGPWRVLALDETINSDGVKEPFWCDFDQIGFNAKTLFVSCDMISDTAAPGSDDPSTAEFARVRVISKSEFQDPKCGPVPCSWWDLEHPTDSDGGFSSPVTPARMYGTGTGDEFLLDESHSHDEITVRRISDTSLCCDGKPDTRPTVTKTYISIPSSDTAPSGTQKGTDRLLSLGGLAVHTAFYYHGWIYGAQTVSCLDSFSCVQIDAIPINRDSEPVQPANPVLRFGTPGLFDAYPAIAPTTSGRMTVVYSQSGTNEFPSVLFSKILPATSRSAPTLAGTGVLARGTSSYLHAGSSKGNRTVGDYFSAAMDPAKFTRVWIRGNLGPTQDHTDWTSVIGETTP